MVSALTASHEGEGSRRMRRLIARRRRWLCLGLIPASPAKTRLMAATAVVAGLALVVSGLSIYLQHFHKPPGLTLRVVAFDFAGPEACIAFANTGERDIVVAGAVLELVEQETPQHSSSQYFPWLNESGGQRSLPRAMEAGDVALVTVRFRKIGMVDVERIADRTKKSTVYLNLIVTVVDLDGDFRDINLASLEFRIQGERMTGPFLRYSEWVATLDDMEPEPSFMMTCLFTTRERTALPLEDECP